MAAVEMGCPTCGAVPGTGHSDYCEDPVMFMAAEAMDQANAQAVARARYELATALAKEATARVEAARDQLDEATQRAGMRPDAARRESMEAAKMAAVRLVHEEGWSEVRAAQVVGINRMTLRKALGKR
jgi:hypothetical protein